MNLLRNAPAKPIRGSQLLDSRKRRADRVNAEQKEMQAALKRDGRICRWPACEYAPKKLPIEAAHVFQHRGMGGNKSGDRTRQSLIAALCRIHHGMLDAARIDIQPLTDDGTDGPLAFYTQHPTTGAFVHVASEAKRGISEPRR